jgi:hypothetical protein
LRRRNADIPNNAAKQWCGSLVAVSAGEARWRCGSRPSFGPPAPGPVQSSTLSATVCVIRDTFAPPPAQQKLQDTDIPLNKPPPPTYLLAPFPPGPTARARRSGGAVLVGVLGRGGAA